VDLAYVSIVRGDDGQPLHYVAQMPDLTDQKKIDEQRDFAGLHDHSPESPIEVC